MSDQNAQQKGPLAAGAAPKEMSGMRAALQYTGIPASWFEKRPKLPSRNWLIFISVTSSIAGYYFYDRRECNRIRQSYVDRVKHLADEPLHSLDVTRKVTVYGAKWPGDEDYDRSLKYFRKYVKPILVAAAVDYEMINGKRHGDIADKIAEQIKSQRRIAMGLDPAPPVMEALASYQPLDVLYRRKLEGGIIIMGRPTFKEFLVGTHRGWTEGLEKTDKEESLSRILENDGHFDEPEDISTVDVGNIDDEPIPTPSKLPSSKGVFSPLALQKQPPISPRDSESIPTAKNTPPSIIPPLPPLLFVPFLNRIGFTQIPIMMWDFFNERYRVQSGSEAGYRLVMKQTRPIEPPTELAIPASEMEKVAGEAAAPLPECHGGDLDFDKDVEAYYKSSLSSTVAEIEKAKTKYYEALPAKLEVARALSRGTREPTKEEVAHAPPTEVELRAERIKKELRWRGDVEGWELIGGRALVWDERFATSMRVFVDAAPDNTFDENKTN